MDFTTVDSLAEHREAAHQWVEKNVQPGWAWEQYTSGTHHTPELHARLASDGILGAGWPLDYGGSDTDPGYARAVLDAVSDVELYTDGWATTLMVLRTVRHVGTEEQKREIIGGALKGEILIALGYSEPDSGSDVAAAKTRALYATVTSGSSAAKRCSRVRRSRAHTSSSSPVPIRTCRNTRA